MLESASRRGSGPGGVGWSAPGGCLVLGGCLLWGVVSAPGGGSGPGGGLVQGGWYPSMH